MAHTPRDCRHAAMSSAVPARSWAGVGQAGGKKGQLKQFGRRRRNEREGGVRINCPAVGVADFAACFRLMFPDVVKEVGHSRRELRLVRAAYGEQ